LADNLLIPCVLLTLLHIFGLTVVWRLRGQSWSFLPIFYSLRTILFELFGLWYCILRDRYYLGTVRFPLSWWCFGLYIEIVYVLLFYCGYIAAVTATPATRWRRSRASGMHEQRARALVAVLFVLGLAGNAIMVATQSGYGQESADYVLNFGGRTGQIRALAGWFSGLYWPSVAAMLYMRLEGALPRLGLGRFARFAVLSSAILFTLNNLFYGQRTAFLEPFILLLLPIIFYYRKRRETVRVMAKRLSFPVLLFIPLLLLAVPAMSLYRAEYRTVDAATAKTTGLRGVVNELIGSHGLVEQSLDTWATRADAYRNGGALAKYAEINGYAGFRPYEGLLYVFIPRLLLPEKPVIGSEDGTYAGYPAYILGRWQASAQVSAGQSAGRSTSGTAYWQFGWIGVLATGALGGYWTGYCARMFLNDFSPLGLLFFLYVSPGGTPERILYDQVIRRMIPIFLLLGLASHRRRWRASRAAGSRVKRRAVAADPPFRRRTLYPRPFRLRERGCEEAT
jgi:hypothetical protein